MSYIHLGARKFYSSVQGLIAVPDQSEAKTLEKIEKIQEKEIAKELADEQDDIAKQFEQVSLKLRSKIKK